MDTLRNTAIVILGSALAASAVMARTRTPFAARSLAVPTPGQVFRPDPPVVPPPPPSDRQVVEAARKARAAKESKQVKEAAKQLTVWNEDNIPRIPRDITVVGHTETNPGAEAAAADSSGAASATSGATPASENKRASETASRDRDAKKEELTRARERAADLEKDSQLAQEQFGLDQNQISQNPDYANDRAGQTKLKSEAAELQAKRQQLDDLKKKIGNLESQIKP
jgi:hypothetical protein